MDKAKVPSPVRSRSATFVLVGTAGAILCGAIVVGATRRDAPAPAPVAAAAPRLEDLHAEARIATQQTAFAMSHLGAMRDESELEPKEPPKKPVAEKRAAPRPASAPMPPAPVALQPPVVAKDESKSPSVFGVSLPSPRKIADRVASIGDSLSSLVRWR